MGGTLTLYGLLNRSTTGHSPAPGHLAGDNATPSGRSAIAQPIIQRADRALPALRKASPNAIRTTPSHHPSATSRRSRTISHPPSRLTSNQAEQLLRRLNHDYTVAQRQHCALHHTQVLDSLLPESGEARANSPMRRDLSQPRHAGVLVGGVGAERGRGVTHHHPGPLSEVARFARSRLSPSRGSRSPAGLASAPGRTRRNRRCAGTRPRSDA